jgi:hypothetical protein
MGDDLLDIDRDLAHGDAGFFLHLPPDGFLDALGLIDEAGQRGVAPGTRQPSPGLT